MDVTIKIPGRRVADLMVTAIEGNHMTRSWCEGVYLIAREGGETGHKGPWYDDPQLYEGGFILNVCEIIDETEAPEGENLKRHACDQAAFAQGFKIMAEKYGWHMGAFLGENEDAITADVFLQCVALKEIVYG